MRKWILGLGALALVLGALFIMGYIKLPGDYNASDVELTFYDEEGNELGKIDTKLAILGVRTAGFEGDIHSIGVRVNFEVTTTMEYVYMYTYCYMAIETVLDDGQYTTVVHSVAESQMDSGVTGLTGSFQGTYLMSDLLPDNKITDTGKQMGWVMTFNSRVKTVLDLEDMTEKTVEDTTSLVLTLTWHEYELKVDSYFVDPLIG